MTITMGRWAHLHEIFRQHCYAKKHTPSIHQKRKKIRLSNQHSKQATPHSILFVRRTIVAKMTLLSPTKIQELVKQLSSQADQRAPAPLSTCSCLKGNSWLKLDDSTIPHCSQAATSPKFRELQALLGNHDPCGVGTFQQQMVSGDVSSKMKDRRHLKLFWWPQ